MPGGSGDGPAGDTGERLSSLPWDEKTENRMLRSRLDEQSQLICLLKRRADETLQRCQALERVNEDLERESEEAERRLQAERKRGDQLEERFGMLASNHEYMIRFKDEYKRQNEQLRGECELLRGDRLPALLEKERSIRELGDQLGKMETTLQQQSTKHQEELRTLSGRHEQLLQQLQERNLQLEALSRRLEDANATGCQTREQLSSLEEVRRNEQNDVAKRLEEAKKEKEDILQLCMERGKALQERQKEAAELNVRIKMAEMARQEAEERYEHDSAAVDANARVRELRSRLEEGEEAMEELKREYEAYKKHVGHLLTTERELNAKLRHLIG